MGIRSFDLRFGKYFQMRHGQLELPEKIDDVLKVLVLAKWDVWSFPMNLEIKEDGRCKSLHYLIVTLSFKDSWPVEYVIATTNFELYSVCKPGSII